MERLQPISEASVPELRRRLGSRLRGLGYQAADELARRGQSQVLLEALQSRDRNLRLNASWAIRLVESTEAVRLLVESLRHDREFFLAAQQALSHRPSPELVPVLVGLARDRGNRNRKFHAMLLADVPGPQVLDALYEGLQGDDQELQEGCFLALKHGREDLRRQAGPALVQALSVRLPLPRRSPLAFTRRARALRDVPLLLIAAVGFSAGDQGVGVLTGIVRSEADIAYRHAALSALVEIGEPAVARSWRLVLSLVQEGDGDLADSAAEALRRLRAAEAEPALLELLLHGSAQQRRNAAHALEDCGGPHCIPDLHDRLGQDREVHVRRTAARTLGVLRDPRSPGFLSQALADRDRWVGWNAAWALGQYRDPALAHRLLAGLEGDDPRLRWSCAEALGQLGQSTPEVLQALVRCVARHRGLVARGAAWALRQLDLAAALGYAVQLLQSPDPRQRRLGQRARYWLQPERASYAPHLPLRSSRRGGLFPSPPRRAEPPPPPGGSGTRDPGGSFPEEGRC